MGKRNVTINANEAIAMSNLEIVLIFFMTFLFGKLLGSANPRSYIIVDCA
jgi:hypothetical protein